MKKIAVRHINSTQQEPALPGRFHIRDIETLVADKNMVQPLHSHSFFYILILKEGFGEHSIDFVSYPVKNATVFIMRPGQVHELALHQGSTGYLVEFDNDFYSPLEKAAHQLLRKVSSNNYHLLDAKKIKTLLPVLENMLQEYDHKQDGYLRVIQSFLDIFFIRLLRQSNNPVSYSAKSSAYMQERLEEFMALIALHVSAHKEVIFYAESLNLTTFQLHTITKRTLDKTASEIINNYIVLEAKRYLLATSNQINQIAAQLGYEDVSYFIRVFKKHTGYAPETFRHKFR
jgi:AraC family transcriptional activator of pobA